MLSQSQGPDNLYLNISISNVFYPPSATPQNKQAIYDETLTLAVLQHPQNYYASIIRFSMPSDQIPLFSFMVDPSQNNPNIGKYIIGVTVSGTDFPQAVTYVPANNLAAPTAAGSAPFFSYNQITSQYYFIYSVQHFINMVNTALAAANTAASTGQTAPFYVFDPKSQLISLIVTSGFIGAATIFMNGLLKPYFDSFNFNTQNNILSGPIKYIHDLSVTPFGGTSPFQFFEEYDAMDLWLDLRKIVVTSSSLPVNPEANPTFSSAAVSLNGTATYLPIVTDYVVIFNNLNDFGSVITYNPTAQYRLIDLSSNTPITRINLNFYWLSKNNTLYPVFISPGQSITAKIGFFKKSLYKAESF